MQQKKTEGLIARPPSLKTAISLLNHQPLVVEDAGDEIDEQSRHGDIHADGDKEEWDAYSTCENIGHAAGHIKEWDKGEADAAGVQNRRKDGGKHKDHHHRADVTGSLFGRFGDAGDG